jgi:hypothetical protein
MNIVKSGGPLFLFATLILVLSISVFFGNTVNVEGYDGLPDNDYPKYLDVSVNVTSENQAKTSQQLNKEYKKDVDAAATPGKMIEDTSSDKTPENTSGGNTDSNPISDYYKWLAFWQTAASAENSDAMKKASNFNNVNQTVVNPVRGIPVTNLADNLGSGAVDVTKTVVNNTSDLAAGAGLLTAGLAAGAGYGAYKLANNAGGAVANGVEGGAGLAKDTVIGGAGMAKDTVTGAVGLAKDTVGGTVGLAKETVSGTIGLAKDILSSRPLQVNGAIYDNNRIGSGVGYGYEGSVVGRGAGVGTNGKMTQFIDPYSYNGALARKGPSNFVPVTADFSAFGK